MLIELLRCGIPPLLTTVDPPEVLRERTRAYAGLHREVAAEHGVATCPFFPPGVLGRADMVLWDRIHPNAQAIARVVEAMLPTVTHLLARSGG